MTLSAPMARMRIGENQRSHLSNKSGLLAGPSSVTLRWGTREWIGSTCTFSLEKRTLTVQVSKIDPPYISLFRFGISQGGDRIRPLGKTTDVGRRPIYMKDVRSLIERIDAWLKWINPSNLPPIKISPKERTWIKAIASALSAINK